MILRAVLVCTPNTDSREADAMRKLTVGMKLSLDGYIAAPGDDLGWSVPSERAVPVVVGAAAPGSPRRRLADLDIMQWVAGINTDPAYAELAGAAIAGE